MFCYYLKNKINRRSRTFNSIHHHHHHHRHTFNLPDSLNYFDFSVNMQFTITTILFGAISFANGAAVAQGGPPSRFSGAVAATTPQFQAFASNTCSGNALGIASQQPQGTGVTCFTLKNTGNSFEASTDGCTFESFTQANCAGTEGLLSQGSCDENLTFKSIRQACS